MTASAVVAENWGLAGIMISGEGKRRMLEIVIEDDDVPGVDAETLADEFIFYMESSYPEETWNSKAWDHFRCYEEFCKSYPFQDEEE